MLNYCAIISLFAPLLAALITAASPAVGGKAQKVAFWMLVLSFLASLPVLSHVAFTAVPIQIPLLATHWNVLPNVMLSIDRLAAIMMVVVSSIGMLLYRYSSRYMQQDPGLTRFMTLLTLCIGTLLVMVSSADLVTLFVTWQLLSWFLCLLAHNFAHAPTAQSSFRTFIMLRAGDIAFLCGIALAYHLFGTLEIAPLFQAAGADRTQFALFGTGLHITGATAVTMLLFIGAMSKSAQFPMHMWLPDSLSAPTPIHALLHAGIINAGGFLLNRLAPLYVLSPPTMHVVLIVGLLTMILGKCIMLTKNDIKNQLGYSTIGQMGYMMMECGLGAFSLAIFHLIAHGLFKATVFLNCGDVIHKARLYPARPPRETTEPPNPLRWLVSLVVSLVLPLAIIIGVHQALGMSFLTPQAVFVFVLFSWVTAAHATLTLFRLDVKWTGMLAALCSIVVISLAYFFAAEHFTQFLYPDAAVVATQFQAAALPSWMFNVLAGMLAWSIVSTWFMLYLRYHDRITMRRGGLWDYAYVFFKNRLYLDGVSLRLFDGLRRIGNVIDRSPSALPVVAVAAMAIGYSYVATAPQTLVSLALPALLLPLFPFHGLYVAALTRAPRAVQALLAVALPLIGLALATHLPAEILPAIGVLSAFGAVWGSVKALMQVRVPQLLAYAAVALYSVLWWHVAQAGQLTPQGTAYASAVTLVIGGLMLAWDRIRVRYGDLDLNEIGGLFRPMPRFSLCVGVLVMAAVGLPPFALCFSYLSILLSPSTTMSAGLVAIVGAWFAASWYMFRLMQRLLFGEQRTDLRYEDLRVGEIAAFVLIIALLFVPVSLPQKWMKASSPAVSFRIGGSQ